MRARSGRGGYIDAVSQTPSETPPADATSTPGNSDVAGPETVAPESATSAADNALAAEIRVGYAFTGPAIQFGAAVVDGVTHPEARVQIPLAVMNRHGLVAGATGHDALPI